jgi:hypothetical protein
MDNNVPIGGFNFGLEVPEIENPPPLVFGRFNADGSPALPNLTGPIFHDHGDVGSGDDNDPKRRRIAKVCPWSDRREDLADG